MPRVIAVTNFKGGIGKTTTTVNIAAGFALKGARVLIVDVDIQSNVRIALGLAEPRRTLYDVMIDRLPISECVVAARPNIDVLATSDDLVGAQSELARRPDYGRVLETALRPVMRQYDFVLIDCSASMTVLNLNALLAASDLLVPTALEHLAIEGLRQLGRNIRRIKGTMGSLRMIVPTMFDARRRQSFELLDRLHAEYGSLVTDPIRINVRLSEATAEGKTIYEYDPRSRGAADYAALVERLSDVFGYQPRQPVQATPPPLPADSAPQPETTLNQQPLFSGPTRQTCPHCSQSLRHVVLAGYHVYFCDTCKYKRQELAVQR